MSAPRGARPGFLFTALLAMGAFFLVGALVVWMLWSATFWLIDRGVDWVPPEWEAQMGKAAIDEMDNDGIDDPVVRATIEDITKRIVAEVPKGTPYTFTMTPVWQEEANAFALPGGQMMVTSGLLAAADSPDEVAGVLGHEIGHVIHRHGFRAMAREVGMGLLLALVVGDDGTIGAIAQGGKELASLGYSRDNELDADRTGVELAYQAGFRAAAINDFFRRQQQEEALHPAAERALAFLSTHPANADRLAQIDALVSKLPPRARSDFRAPAAWADVRKRAAAIPAAVKAKLAAKKKKEEEEQKKQEGGGS